MRTIESLKIFGSILLKNIWFVLLVPLLLFSSISYGWDGNPPGKKHQYSGKSIKEMRHILSEAYKEEIRNRKAKDTCPKGHRIAGVCLKKIPESIQKKREKRLHELEKE